VSRAAEHPLVSVIVVAPELNAFGRRCLAALLELGEEIELIFVPDRVPDELDPRVIAIASGTDVTTGRKRQLGLARARGEFVALIDDDAYPHPSWLRIAIGTLREDPEVAAIAGPTLTPAGDTELEQLGGRVYASPLVSGPHRWRYRMEEEMDVDDAPSVNLIVRRSEAVAVGLDSDDRWGEDTLFSEGLLRRGGRIRYEPGAIVYHSRRALWKPHLRQLYRWSRHRSAYARTIGGNSLRASYFAPSALLVFVLSGLVLRGPLRRLWAAGVFVYALACLIAGVDRSPARWLRTSGGIAATHVVYGTGFLAGLLGARPVRR
jgi:succinoglycan biosynthesis protein ExoA